jgi:predicted N-acetyltransferase YhbS
MDFECRAARASDFPAIMEVLARCFDEVAPEFFVAQTQEDSTFRLRHARVAVRGGRVLAYVRIFARTMLVRGEPVRAGGIGSVATHPDMQHSGSATALLEEAIAQMRREGMAVTFLFTGIPGFYERLGYRIVREPQITVSRAEVIARKTYGDYNTVVVDYSRHAGSLLRLYRGASKGATGRIVRTPRTWLDARAWLQERTAGYIAGGDKNGGPVGYIRSRCRDFGHQILEAEHAPGHEAAVRHLLEITAFDQCDCDDAIVALVPDRSTLAAVMRSYESARETTDVAHPMMVRTLADDPALDTAFETEPISFWNSDRI